MSWFSRNATRVVETVFSAASSAAATQIGLRTQNFFNETFSVIEVTGRHAIEEVAQFEIILRERSLVLHGVSEIQSLSPTSPTTKSSLYNIILHVPGSERMFNLYRTDDLQQAQDIFILYRETFPDLCIIDPSICEKDKLDRISLKLRENRGWCAVHILAFFDYFKCFSHPLAEKNLNQQEGEFLRTPLHIAIINKCNSTVRVLLSNDLVKMDIQDMKNSTVFHFGAQSTSVILQMLFDNLKVGQHDLIDYLNSDGCTPLHIACKSKNVDVITKFLNHGANLNIPSKKGGYPIHLAVESRSNSSIQVIIAHSPDHISLRDLEEGGTPLHFAHSPETIEYILDLGGDPNVPNENGDTPLHNMIRKGCLKSALHLLGRKANPDVRNKDGNTPLHIAAELCSKFLIQALVIFNANLNIENELGETPRHLLCRSQRSDKDYILFFLSKVGARRCKEKIKEFCVQGCIYQNTGFDGIPPEGFNNFPTTNLLHESLYASSIKNDMKKQLSSEMEKTLHQLSIDETDEPNEKKCKDEVQIGGRLLTLDGGGIRGLVLTQMLLVLEKEFECPLIDLFDWVAGTSTGGILALGLACNKSVAELQGLYIRLKDKVFQGDRPYNSDVMEEFLKAEFGAERKMNDILRPRVMITSALVDRRPAEFHFFRNYFSPASLLEESEPHKEFPDEQYVWKTAKATGSAPSYFRLSGNFIDGGLISNNPTLDALSELQNFKAVMESFGQINSNLKLPSVVLSLGTGIPPQVEANASQLDITWPNGLIDAVTKAQKLHHLVNLLIDQATQSEGQVVERARSWCASIGVPFFRFSPKMSRHVELDEKNDEVLVNLMWETRAYILTHIDSIRELKEILRKHETN